MKLKISQIIFPWGPRIEDFYSYLYIVYIYMIYIYLVCVGSCALYWGFELLLFCFCPVPHRAIDHSEQAVGGASCHIAHIRIRFDGGSYFACIQPILGQAGTNCERCKVLRYFGKQKKKLCFFFFKHQFVAQRFFDMVFLNAHLLTIFSFFMVNS